MARRSVVVDFNEKAVKMKALKTVKRHPEHICNNFI